MLSQKAPQPAAATAQGVLVLPVLRSRNRPPVPSRSRYASVLAPPFSAAVMSPKSSGSKSLPRVSFFRNWRSRAALAAPCLRRRLYASTPNSIKKSQDFLLALQSVLSPKIEKELTIARGFARTCWCAPRAASLPCVAAAVCHLKLIASRAQAAPTMLPVRCLFCCFFLARCLPRAGLQVLPAAECRSGGRAASRDSSLPSCSNKIKRMRLFQFPMHVSLG